MTFDFEWKDDYAIGVEEIDSQHKRFLQLIQKISGSKPSEAGIQNTNNLIDELEKYLVFHTKSEEMLMILYSYPKYDEQKQEHAKVIEQVQKKIDKLSQKPEELAELLLFLLKWFVSHTTYLDKDLGKFINMKRNHGANIK